MMLRKSTKDSKRYKIRISETAVRELDDIMFWYEMQNENLSLRFYNDLTKGFKKILNYPQSYQKIKNDVRRYLMKKFPFSVIYRIDKINSEIELSQSFTITETQIFGRKE